MVAPLSDEEAARPGGIGLAWLLGLVTLVQALATFAVLALPTLATRAAPSFGLGPESVGYQISVVYIAGAIMSGMAGVFVRRHGAAMSSCLSMVVGAIGLAGIASGWLPLGVVSSLIIGIAYGLTNPAASHLLFRFSPPRRQNLIFALKQTGVPAGGMLATLLLPALDKSVGWQAAMLIGAGLLLLLAVPLWMIRAKLDDDRNPTAKLSGGLLTGVKLVLDAPKLRAFAIMGFCYAMAQFCLFAFMITMLVEEFSWTLVAAGVLTTFMQVGGAAGRVIWSLLADWIGRGVDVLIAIGVLSALFAILLALADKFWPAWLLTILLVAFGFCLIGWNGLWLAEIARSGRPDEVGLATGGILFFTFLGIVVGPATFATLFKLIGSYAVTYGVVSVAALMGVAALMRVRRP